jgi:hypothetical protein
MYSIFRNALVALAVSCCLALQAIASEPEDATDAQNRLLAEIALDAAFTRSIQEEIEAAMQGVLDHRVAEQITALDRTDRTSRSRPAARAAFRR